jgi:hypothetical protein
MRASITRIERRLNTLGARRSILIVRRFDGIVLTRDDGLGNSGRVEPRPAVGPGEKWMKRADRNP